MIKIVQNITLILTLPLALCAQGGGGNGANGQGQIGGTVYQNFNQSVNQIGDCWQWENMKITTKNTLFSANQKKALTGTVVDGDPAYTFTSPLINFIGTGNISFYHKLDYDNGLHRELRLVLLDQGENQVAVLHNHVYIDSLTGTRPNGNPTLNYYTSHPVTFSGNYFLRWETVSKGGTSFSMFDNIEIDGYDQSDGSNDNGYGYCRADDVVYDTICAGSNYRHVVPYPIPGSPWSWEFTSPSGGSIDSSHVAGNQDTAIMLQWDFSASGDYLLEATETRRPYNTTTYSVEFRIHVLPVPSLNFSIDTVCPGEYHTADFDFSASDGPWTVTYTDGDSTYTDTFSASPSQKTLGIYSADKNVQILSLVGANGCPADTNNLPQATATFYPSPNTGPIWHW